MDLTPKKIVESSSRCFICSSASLKNNKIFIFGKSSLDIAEVIRSSLSMEHGVSRYSENSELFVCRDKCYQRLIKCNRVSDKLKELKKEIEEVFKARENPRVNRLLHPDENADSGAKTVHQLHHLEEKHPNRCDLPIPLGLLLPSTKIRMRWEHQFLLTERRWVPAYHRFKVIPLVWSYGLFQMHN